MMNTELRITKYKLLTVVGLSIVLGLAIRGVFASIPALPPGMDPANRTGSLLAVGSVEIRVYGRYETYMPDYQWGGLWFPLRGGGYMGGHDVKITITGMGKVPVDEPYVMPSPVQIDYEPLERTYQGSVLSDIDGDGDTDLRDWALALPYWTGPKTPVPED